MLGAVAHGAMLRAGLVGSGAAPARRAAGALARGAAPPCAACAAAIDVGRWAAGAAVLAGPAPGAAAGRGCGAGDRGFHASAPALQQKAKGARQKFFTRLPPPVHQRRLDRERDVVGGMLPAWEEGAEGEGAGRPVWTPESRRVGVVALKCGMMPDWDDWGERHPLTVLKLEHVQVSQVKTADVHGFTALQVAAAAAKPNRTTMPMAGHFAAAGIEPKRVLSEFRVTPDAVLPVGTEITARHFVPGQLVDVTGTTKGKGFQGGMKRWGFKGQPATHGVSKAHRSLGSTGASQGPGRVWKGKKMPGHMGVKTRTTQGLLVYKVDLRRNLVYVRGAVPGHEGGYVRIRDSIKHTWDPEAPPPFPTHVPTPEDAELLAAWRSGDIPTFLEAAEAAAMAAGTGLADAGPAFEIVMEPQVRNPFGIHDDEEGEA